MAAQTKSTSRTLYLDTLSAQRELELLTQKVEKLDKKIVEGQASGKKMTKEIADLDKAKASVAKVQEQIDKGLKPSLKQLEDFARRTNNELKRMSQSDPEFAKKIAQYKDAQSQIRILRAEMSGTVNAQKGMMSLLKDFGSGLTEGFLIGGIAALGIGVSKFIGGAIDEIEQAEMASARLENKLRNLGRLDVFPRLQAEAEDLAKSFGYLDNDDILQVFSKLIDYGKLTETQIKKLTPVIIDFAANQRISLEEAASVIIKALEGNGKALKEYGINLKDAGSTTEAFGIIMDQLKPKVEGAAKTFGETSAGQVAKFTQHVKDLQEQIGEKILPAKVKFYEGLNYILSGFGLFVDSINKMASKITFWDFFKPGALIKKFKEASDGIVDEQSNFEDFQKSSQQSINKRVDVINKYTVEGRKKAIKLLTDENKLFVQSLELAQQKNDDASINFYKRKLYVSNQVLSQLNNQPLGGGNPDDNFTDTKTKIKENPRIKLLNELKQLEDEVALLGKSNDEKELQRILQKYQKLLNEAKKYADITIELEKLRNKEVAFWIEEVTKKQAEEHKKQEQQEKEKTEKLREQLMKRKENEIEDARKRNAFVLDIDNRNALAQAKLRSISSPWGRARIEAEKELLQVEMEQALQNEKLTEDEKELIREQYRQRQAQLEFEFYAKEITQYLDYTQQILSVVDTFYQIQNNKENARLQKELKQFDQRRIAYKKLLDQRIISETEYNRKINALQEDEDKKKRDLARKQFNRQKGIQIAQAYIGGALAAIQSVANTTLPFPASLIGPIIIGAGTIAQIALIASQKPPEFARGGIAQGGRHSEGGIDMIDRRSGRRVGNMEGGEPYMILSRNTYANNGDIIDELLDASMNRNGARINPGRMRRFWETRTYTSLNYNRASTALSRRYFERGGIVNTNTAAAAEPATDETAAKLEQMTNVVAYLAQSVDNLNAVLANGIEAKMSLKKFRDAEALDSRITDDSTFKA